MKKTKNKSQGCLAPHAGGKFPTIKTNIIFIPNDNTYPTPKKKRKTTQTVSYNNSKGLANPIFFNNFKQNP